MLIPCENGVVANTEKTLIRVVTLTLWTSSRPSHECCRSSFFNFFIFYFSLHSLEEVQGILEWPDGSFFTNLDFIRTFFGPSFLCSDRCLLPSAILKVALQRTQRNAFDFIPNIKNATIRVSLKDSIIPRSVWLFSVDITRAAFFFRSLIYCDSVYGV